MSNQLECIVWGLAYGCVVGVWLGSLLEARKWREKAENSTRMLSAGKLYYVRRDLLGEDVRK